MSRSIKFRRGSAALVLTAALGLVAAGCGDDESTTSASEESTTSASEETTAASGDSIDVTATEYEFDVSATPTTGTKSVEFINDGKEFHVFVFAKLNEGFTVDEAIKLEGEKGSAELIAETEAAPGETSTAEVKGEIVAGEDYVMLCPVGGPDGPHYKLGQLEEFQVEE